VESAFLCDLYRSGSGLGRRRTGRSRQGKALLFPGTPGNAVNLGTFNPSEKSGMLSVSLWAKWNGLSPQWQGLIGKRGERKMVRPQRGRA